jgi:hypothetical protein
LTLLRVLRIARSIAHRGELAVIFAGGDQPIVYRIGHDLRQARV